MKPCFFLKKIVIDTTNAFMNKSEWYVNGFEAVLDLTNATDLN